VYVDKIFHMWLDDTRLKFQTCNLSELGKRTHRDLFVVELDIRSTKCAIFVGVFKRSFCKTTAVSKCLRFRYPYTVLFVILLYFRL